MKMLLRTAVLLGLVTAALAGEAAVVIGSVRRAHRPGRSVIWHLKFNELGDLSVITNGRYVVLTRAGLTPTSNSTSTLIDEQTGTRTDVPTGAPAFGGPWLWWLAMTSAGGSQPVVHRYKLGTGQEQTISVKGGCNSDAQCSVGPVGTDWLEECISAYHVATTCHYQNLLNGQTWQEPLTSPRYVADFDSPSFSRRLCSPLRNTDNNQLILDASGLFDISGTPMDPFAEAYGGPEHRPYLERCGSHLHTLLAGYADTANARVLLFYPGRTQVRGIFLSSRRPLEITFPPAMTKPTQIVPNGGVAGVLLSSRTIYVTGSDATVWSARLPMMP